ncbi:MAG: dTDP-4-dehydrorhamnose 3,5-epimerase [Spirosomataceae bacterium]
MEFNAASLPGLIEIVPKIFHDERGFFFESYSKKMFTENGISDDFVQDNHSFSVKGVLRGLHYQNPPFAQGKLVRAVTGKVMDVVVDIRQQSPTFGQHAKFILDAAVGNMLYVPAGFAHGFVALEDAVFAYKCTAFYDKPSEGGIIWNDPQLAIDWRVENPIVSAKDQQLPLFSECVNKF